MTYLYFLVPLAISAILILPVKQLAFKFNIYAKENNRTVHHGKIPRIGGVAIYLAFIISALIFVRENDTFNGIILGGTIIFIEGLIDDIFDVPPWFKLVFQFIATSVLVFYGKVYLASIKLPFGIVINMKAFSYVVTYLWVIGITNAVNLIDGLDGLAGGFCTIVLVTIAILSTIIHSPEEYVICLMLAGSIMGFLYYNFHPASIFMGDCGAQFLGFMIAAISLYGFKSTTFITLAIPITLMFVPIFDTFSAIIRRKLKGQKISAPDKSHFHHILMKNMKLGQTGAVIAIYIVTALFGLTSYLYCVNTPIGICLLIFMIIMFDLFIEYTGMITKKYRPILNLLDKLMNHHIATPADEEEVEEKAVAEKPEGEQETVQ